MAIGICLKLFKESRILSNLKENIMENIVKNGENEAQPAFSPSVTMFSTPFFFFLAHLSTKCASTVSVFNHALSVVNFLHCVCSRGHIFSLILLKLGQNVYPDKISLEFKNGSCWVKK